MHKLADLRTEYSKRALDVDGVSADPVVQFQLWFDEAMKAKLYEPNAMTLSTVNESGRPSARIVLLKGIEDKGFVFYTNYQSKKGKELESNPVCALTFFWAELERQVRIEGIVKRVNSAQSDAYFQSRPRGSQIGAWASPQSTIIQDRSILEERAKQMETRFESKAVLPRPQQWGGYHVDPFMLEFWQGRPNRLHDRIEYVKVDGAWKHHRLAP